MNSLLQRLPRTRAAGALLLLLGTLWQAGCSDSNEPLYTRPDGPPTAIETANDVRQRLETVLAEQAASAGGDVDSTEAVIDDILPGLSRKLRRSVENLELPNADIQDLFAERVEVADVESPDHFEHVEAYDLEVGHWHVNEKRELAREDLDIWNAFLGDVDYLENASFKVVRGEFLDEGQTVLHTLMKFASLARRGEGYRHAHGKMYVDWAKVDEGETEVWRIKGWVTKHFETHDVDELFFGDILPNALDPETYALVTERSIDLDKRIATVAVNLERERTQNDVRSHLDDGMLPFTRQEFEASLPDLSRKEREYAYRFFGARLKDRGILMRVLDLDSVEELDEIDLAVRERLIEERRKQRPEVAKRLQSTLEIVRETLSRQEEAAEGKSKSSTAISITDFDRDGLDDIWMARNDHCFLLRNKGDGTFEDIGDEIDLPQNDPRYSHVNSALFVDLDNDDDMDVLYGYWDGIGYFRNEDGRLVDRTAELYDAYRPMGNVSLSAADYDGDGLLDVYVGTRDMFRASQELMARSNLGFDEGKLFSDYLPEEQARRFYDIAMSGQADGTFDRPGPPNLLLRNMGGGRLALSPESHKLEVYRGTHFASWSDYDNDGDPDLYVANDFGPNNFFRNDAGRFVEVTEETGTADVGFGMGCSWGDYDNDGDQDLYVTNMYSKAGLRITTVAGMTETKVHVAAHGNTLFRNDGDRFVKTSGTEPPALLVEPGGWGWGAQMLEMDNDGYLDIYAPSGYISKPPGFGAMADT